MKKTLLLAALASFAMVSCSNDEEVAVSPKNAIGFSNFVSNTTRAAEATTDNLLNMTVYGFIGGATPVKNFDGQIVSRANASAEWSYTPLQYWIGGKDYFFTAVASPALEGTTRFTYAWPSDADLAAATTAGFNGLGTISFDNSNSDGANGNNDLVYATAKKTTVDPLSADPGVVQFAFKHALSRVIFTFKNAMGSDAYSVKVSGLTINNAYGKGSLVLGSANPTWTGTNPGVLVLRDNLYTPNTQIAANSGQVQSGTKFIIPGTQALKISFKVELLMNGTVLHSYNHTDVLLPETAFQNGYSYNFIATLDPSNINPGEQMFPIKFSVSSVDAWEDADDSNVTLPETPAE